MSDYYHDYIYYFLSDDIIYINVVVVAYPLS